MDWLVATPFILLISLIGEIWKLNLSKTTLDREAVFQREQKNCIFSYILVIVLLVYFLVAGKSPAYPLGAAVWTAGMHMGAAIWKDNQ